MSTLRPGLKVRYVFQRDPLNGQIRDAVITHVADDLSVTLIDDTAGGAELLGSSFTTAGVRFSAEPKPHTWHHIP